MDEDAHQIEPVFRANKRRKVFRKRANSQEDDDQTEQIEPHATHPRPDNGQDGGNAEATDGQAVQVRRPKKHGIAFSSSGTGSRQTQNQDQDDALIMTAPPVSGALQQQNERFTKPTGRAVVTDDKHMYVTVRMIAGKICRGAALTA